MLLVVFIWEVIMRQHFGVYQVSTFEALHPLIPSFTLLHSSETGFLLDEINSGDALQHKLASNPWNQAGAHPELKEKPQNVSGEDVVSSAPSIFICIAAHIGPRCLLVQTQPTSRGIRVTQVSP